MNSQVKLRIIFVLCLLVLMSCLSHVDKGDILNVKSLDVLISQGQCKTIAMESLKVVGFDLAHIYNFDDTVTVAGEKVTVAITCRADKGVIFVVSSGSDPESIEVENKIVSILKKLSEQ